jgi:hypothetical protein
MQPKLLEVMQKVYDKAVFSVTKNQPCELTPDEFRGLLRFFVLVNMNQTVQEAGILPAAVANPPDTLIDELSESLTGLSASLKAASVHLHERNRRLGRKDNDVN